MSQSAIRRDPESAGWPLAELADKVRTLAAGGKGLPNLVRLSVPAPVVDPLVWLGSQPRGVRAYWSGRDTDRTIAMVGAADSYGGSDEINYRSIEGYVGHMLEQADPKIRYYGGVRFDVERAADELWSPFGSFRFVLPRFEYVLEEGRAELACNVVMARDRDRLETVARACRGLALPRQRLVGTMPALMSRADEPQPHRWKIQIEGALREIGRHAMQKVVLARRSTLDFDGPLPPLSLFARLRQAAPNRFHYFFEAGDGSAFLGATPERLFYRNGESLVSEAVAGTRPCAANKADDDALRSALMHSEKDQREHLSVRWAIEEILRPFCSQLSVDAEASEMRLAKGRHLVSRFKGTLRAGVSSWELLRRLHPTPAVGGYPAKAAIEAIRDTERFDRGWYAGPVGWIGSGEADFAVALRCGLVRRSQLHLYSGAGIVEGSVPDLEWDEIEHKIVDFANVLGLSPVGAE